MTDTGPHSAVDWSVQDLRHVDLSAIELRAAKTIQAGHRRPLAHKCQNLVC